MKRILQGRKTLFLAAAAVLLFSAAGIATAKTAPTDEKQLKGEITMIDKDATMPRGGQIVADRLAKEFKVTAGQVTALRDKNLGYGEIAAVYAFADKMSGGLTDENVGKVMSLREGGKEWGTIAEGLNVDLGDVAGKVGNIEKDAHRDIKTALTETGGAGAGGVSRPDRSDPLYQ